MLLAFGEFGADAGGGVEGSDACAGGADAFGEGALGNEFSFGLACVVELFEVGGLGGMGSRGEGADDFFDASGFDEGSEVYTVVEGAGAGVVGDGGEVGRALSEEGGDEVAGGAGAGESRDHDGCAVGDVGDGLVEGVEDLVLQFEPLSDWGWV